MHVDVPSEQLLPDMEEGIKRMVENLMSGEKKKVVVEKVEWTEKGLRVWIQN
jgi:hypothetical protein